MTTLHAGGKFGDGGYKVSGGLHGVGVSVVNALSSRLVLEVDRDGNTYRQVYAPEKKGNKINPGVPQAKLRAVAKSKRGHTGTTITFWPDPEVFEEIEFRAATIMERLQVMAFLHAGLTIGFHDERPGHKHEATFHNEAGIVDFVRHLNASKEPLIRDVGSFSASEAEGDVEVAWQWNTGYHEGLHTFANGISTTEGGMHAEGFKRALTNAINRYAKDRGLLKAKEAAFQGDDVREGLTAIVSVRLAEPQFEGQTKSKLGNTEIRSLVERLTGERFGRWLEENPNPAKAIVAKAAGRGAAPAARRSRPASSRDARARSKASACPTSSPTARRASSRRPSSSSSRATAPVVPRATRAPRRPRRSCRCGGRSSTSSARRSTRSSPTPRSRPSSRPSAVASATTSTSPRRATARS